MGLIRNGKKNLVSLSGNHDLDLLLTKNDMSISHWNLLMKCYHNGQCYSDVKLAKQYFHIEHENKALQYLLNCGIERDKFIDDNGDINSSNIELYYLWLLSGDIQELN
jgi:hypothetical protein